MTAIIILGIIIFIILVLTRKKKTVQQITNVANFDDNQQTAKEIEAELVQKSLRNLEIIRENSRTKNTHDDSIIDVTDKSFRINSNNNLIKSSSDVPYWTYPQYVYSYSELNSASVEQKKFYGI
jgi:hypothetical protein